MAQGKVVHPGQLFVHPPSNAVMALHVHMDKVGEATGCNKESLEQVVAFCAEEGIETVQDLRGFSATFEAAKERWVTVAQACVRCLQEPAYDMEEDKAIVEEARIAVPSGAPTGEPRPVAIKLRKAVAPQKHQAPPEERRANADRLSAAKQAVELSLS